MARRQVDIIVKAHDQASRNMKRASGASARLASRLRALKFAAIAAAAAMAYLTFRVLKMGLKDAIEAAKVQGKLAAVLEATGHAAGFTAEELLKVAEGLEKITPFSAEATMEVQSLLATFKAIKGDVFVEATEAVLDMATVMEGGAQPAAIRLGKALQDPILGATALRRVGVMLTEQQMQQIKAFVASGRVMEAQRIILAELKSEFGGTARAAGEEFAGKMEILKNMIGEVVEVLGEGLMPILSTFGDIVKAQLPAIKEFAQGLVKEFKDLGIKAAEAFDGIREKYSEVVTHLAVGMLTIRKEWTGFLHQLGDGWTFFVTAVKNGWLDIRLTANTMMAQMADEYQTFTDDLAIGMFVAWQMARGKSREEARKMWFEVMPATTEAERWGNAFRDEIKKIEGDMTELWDVWAKEQGESIKAYEKELETLTAAQKALLVDLSKRLAGPGLIDLLALLFGGAGAPGAAGGGRPGGGAAGGGAGGGGAAARGRLTAFESLAMARGPGQDPTVRVAQNTQTLVTIAQKALTLDERMEREMQRAWRNTEMKTRLANLQG